MSEVRKLIKNRGKCSLNLNRLAVLDIETEGLDATKFVFGVVYHYDGKSKIFTNKDEMRQYLLSTIRRNTIFVAHNGGKFDYLSLFPDALTNKKFEIVYNGSRFIMMRYRVIDRQEEKKKHEYIYFFDSLNLLQTSVEKLGNVFGLEKLQRREYHIGDTITNDDIKYCTRDCEIVMRALCRLFELVGAIKPTIASCAMYLYNKTYMEHGFSIDELDNAFIDAYYGGRTEAYYIGKTPEPLNVYDVNSLYPFCMTMKLPNPKTFVEETNISPQQFINILNSYEGMAEIVFECDAELPILPVRHGNKLIFPNGILFGSYCFPEIRLALNEQQIRIREVRRVIYTKDAKPYLAKYANDLYTLRKQCDNEADKLLYKYLLNSLYGKFAQINDISETHYVNANDISNEQMYAMLNNGYTLTNLANNIIMCRRSKGEEFAAHDIVCWSAYITSYARCVNYQYQKLIKSLGGKVYYTDTDSFATNIIIPEQYLGNEFGKLKLEDYKIIKIYGAKEYEFVKNNQIGEKLKGVPKNAEHQIVNGKDIYTYTQIASYKISTHKEGIVPGQPLKINKTPSREYTKRLVNSDGSTIPLEINMIDNMNHEFEKLKSSCVKKYTNTKQGVKARMRAEGIDEQYYDNSLRPDEQLWAEENNKRKIYDY